MSSYQKEPEGLVYLLNTFLTQINTETKLQTGESTEFIISFTKKKYLFNLLDRILETNPNDDDTIYALWLSLYISNKYLIEHKSLENLFSYLCSLDQPLLLFQHCDVKKYLTSDIIPMIPYKFIKDHLLKEGIQIGSYTSHTFFVFYMIGKLISFVITEDNVCRYIYINESDSVEHIKIIEEKLSPFNIIFVKKYSDASPPHSPKTKTPQSPDHPPPMVVNWDVDDEMDFNTKLLFNDKVNPCLTFFQTYNLDLLPKNALGECNLSVLEDYQVYFVTMINNI